MINADMRAYDYYTYGAADAYGQQQLSQKQGYVKMAINSINISAADNIRFKDATYLGLTLAAVNDSFVIQYGEERLKVLYVLPKGRYKQVFMKKI